jgi:hypothetical protein
MRVKNPQEYPMNVTTMAQKGTLVNIDLKGGAGKFPLLDWVLLSIYSLSA